MLHSIKLSWFGQTKSKFYSENCSFVHKINYKDKTYDDNHDYDYDDNIIIIFIIISKTVHLYKKRISSPKPMLFLLLLLKT